jgi:hypothetical protein
VVTPEVIAYLSTLLTRGLAITSRASLAIETGGAATVSVEGAAPLATGPAVTAFGGAPDPRRITVRASHIDR